MISQIYLKLFISLFFRFTLFNISFKILYFSFLFIVYIIHTMNLYQYFNFIFIEKFKVNN